MKHIMIPLVIIITAILIIFTSCETKPTEPKTDNPFDRLNSDTKGDPFNLSAKIANGGILLKWTIPNSNSVSAFKVYRSEAETIGYKAVATLPKDRNSFTDRFIQNGYNYWYRVTAADKNNNESEITNTAAVNIKTEPVLVINGGDKYTTIRTVQLTILAATAEQIMLSNNSDFTNAVWEEYNTIKNWTLSVNDGTKNVYMKVKYSNGNESEAVSSQIIMDTTPPTIIISVKPDSGITNETEFQFNPTQSRDYINPAESLLVRYDYENDGAFDTEWLQLSVVSHQYAVGGGNKTVKVQLKDGAGWQTDTTIIVFVNTRPDASFSTVLDDYNYKKIHFDAIKSSDYEDGIILEYRWDFNGDENWDTEWLLQDTISYIYPLDGEYNVKLLVRDQNNLSNEISKQIIVASSLTDIDGNVYKVVKIGTQLWMAENLKVTHYRNGDTIPTVTDNTQWSALSNGAYCAYNNDNVNIITYGLLYNWYAVNDNRKIAPNGWHIPTDEEWQTMVDYLGESGTAGGKLRESGTSHWNAPNSGATNSSGFTALPAGYRDGGNGAYYRIGKECYWWSSTRRLEYSYDVWIRGLSYDMTDVIYGSNNMDYGYSIRLIKD